LGLYCLKNLYKRGHFSGDALNKRWRSAIAPLDLSFDKQLDQLLRRAGLAIHRVVGAHVAMLENGLLALAVAGLIAVRAGREKIRRVAFATPDAPTNALWQENLPLVGTLRESLFTGREFHWRGTHLFPPKVFASGAGLGPPLDAVPAVGLSSRRQAFRSRNGGKSGERKIKIVCGFLAPCAC